MSRLVLQHLTRLSLPPFKGPGQGRGIPLPSRMWSDQTLAAKALAHAVAQTATYSLACRHPAIGPFDAEAAIDRGARQDRTEMVTAMAGAAGTTARASILLLRGILMCLAPEA